VPWYPAREGFDYHRDESRWGSLDGPVLNSFVNTPSYGDERAFLHVRIADQPPDTNVNVVHLPALLRSGVALLARIYVHNNANPAIGERGVTLNLRARVLIPTGAAQGLRIRAYLSMDRAAPRHPTLIEDTADIVADVPFTLQPLPRTARLLRADRISPIDNALFGPDGALLGDRLLDGRLPGCFEYAALVELGLRALPA
jgi:hypothetical protein